MLRTISKICLGALVLVFGLAACGNSTTSQPTLIGPQNWQIVTGGSAQAEALQTLDYYPNAMTINVGDSITWTNNAIEHHTVSIPPAGQRPPLGPPQPKVGGNTFDGTSYISSGFFNAGATYTVTFTTAGFYRVFCLIHQPEMVLDIVVQPAGSPHPKTQAEYTALGQADFTIDINAAAASVQEFPYAIDGPTLAAGIQPGAPNGPPTQSSVVRFLHGKTLDQTITIPRGSTLTWNNISQLPHNVALPILGQPIAPGSPNRPRAGGSTYDGTVFTNSGRMEPGASYSLTFTKSGTYTYYCLFHTEEGMVGTVIVI